MRRTFFEERELQAARVAFDLRGAAIVDIGANIGNHTIYLTKIAMASSCIAFEPSAYAFKILKRNIEINNLSNLVDARQIALSNEAGRLSYGPQWVGNSGAMSFIDGGNDGVEAATLDSMKIAVADLIKIDVEGMAARVLAGAKETISALRPVLMIEITPPESRECGVILGALGYRKSHSFDHDTYIYERSYR